MRRESFAFVLGAALVTLVFGFFYVLSQQGIQPSLQHVEERDESNQRDCDNELHRREMHKLWLEAFAEHSKAENALEAAMSTLGTARAANQYLLLSQNATRQEEALAKHLQRLDELTRQIGELSASKLAAGVKMLHAAKELENLGDRTRSVQTQAIMDLQE